MVQKAKPFFLWQSVFPLALGMPLLPRNPSQVYGAQPHENVSDSTMGTSIFGEAPPIPYEQPEQVPVPPLV